LENESYNRGILPNVAAWFIDNDYDEESFFGTHKEIIGFPRHGWKSRPCRDGGGGEIVRFFASVRKGDRACNIDPPESSYAIMRRARPYRGENSGARQG
jgi:hypothetical protein